MRDYLGISEIGQCARRVYYAHRPEWQEAKAETPEGLRVMAMGNALEGLILAEWHLKKFGGAKAPRIKGRQAEVAFGPCKGHLDGYVLVDGHAVVLDAKASTLPAMTQWKRNGLPDYYRAQGLGYISGLGALLGKPVNEAIFVAMDRLSGRLEEFSLAWDEDAGASLLSRTHALARAIENGPMPDREHESHSTACKHCPWRQSCWGAEELDYEDADAGRVLDATDWPGFEEQAQEYVDAGELLSLAKARQDDAKAALEAMLREHGAYGGSAAGFRVTGTKVHQEKFDSKRFREAQPDLYEKYQKAVDFVRLDVRRKG